MTVYKIAHRLSLAARRVAAGTTYDYEDFDGDGSSPSPRCAAGFCPLGLALSTDLLLAFPDWKKPTLYAPQDLDVADLLVHELGADHRDYDAIVQDAEDFIEDWDAGLIDNLAIALNIKSNGEVQA